MEDGGQRDHGLRTGKPETSNIQQKLLSVSTICNHQNGLNVHPATGTGGIIAVSQPNLRGRDLAQAPWCHMGIFSQISPVLGALGRRGARSNGRHASRLYQWTRENMGKCHGLVSRLMMPANAPAQKAGGPAVRPVRKVGLPSVASRFRLGYCRSFDGIRGVAILLVVCCHGQVVAPGYAFIGVNTFFVLSGFLITSLLIEEYDETKRISLPQFYLRRALRLLPALTVMLAAFLLFAFLVDPHKRALREVNESLFALFYFTNWADIYHIGRHVSLVHTWTLSVEEQFYILWPGILLFMLPRMVRSSVACWIFLGVFLSVLVRIGLLVADTTNLSGNILPVEPNRLSMGTDTRADSLLLGCFAGVLLSSNLLPTSRWFSRLLAAVAVFAGPALLALGHPSPDSAVMVWAGWFLASLLAMALILHLVSTTGTRLHRLLENPVLVFTGQISYGLYIWHYAILEAMDQHHLPWRHLEYLAFVMPVVLVSYYLNERPCLKLKRHFSFLEKVHSSANDAVRERLAVPRERVLRRRQSLRREA